MKKTIIILGIILLIVLVLWMRAISNNKMTDASYGQPVKITEGQVIGYPDFSIEFQGKRFIIPPSDPGPGGPRETGYTMYEFKVEKDTEEVRSVWSKNSHFQPATFTIGNKAYFLDVRVGDELVITPK